MAESAEDGALFSHVARRHGLTPQQLFAWRRQAGREAEGRYRALAERGDVSRASPRSPVSRRLY